MKYSATMKLIRDLTRKWLDEVRDDPQMPVEDIDEADVAVLASDITFSLWSSGVGIEPDGKIQDV